MELEGEVISIIYQNEVNSYTIAEMYVDEIDGKEDNLIRKVASPDVQVALQPHESKKLNLVTSEKSEDFSGVITIVGYLPFVVEGDTLKVTGKFVEHKEYGKQFKVDIFEKLMPQTLEALERYLGNGMIKGVGPATASKIIKTFKDDTINTIKFQPLKLSQIRGITKEKAIEISESFIEHWEVWQIVGFLEKFGIGAENSKRVYDELGVNAIEQIEANPYILIDIVRGVDFRQVDKMAMDIGLEKNNDKRIKSAIKYGLIRITYNGHSCTLKENLLEFVRMLLGISEEYIEDSYINLKINEEIIEEKRENNEIWVYLANFYRTEISISQKIKDLKQAKNYKYIKNIKKELEKIELIDDIILSDKQKEAIEVVNDHNVAIITGGPGTGKTTIIKSIIQIYESKGNKVVLCAPTGRAAKRMTETTGKEASTLHRLLEIGKFNEDIYLNKKEEYQGTPIDADLVIVDELSMVDMFLMNYLISSIYKGTKLILVGDSDQLPSVGPGSILKDLIESEEIETIHLDKVFRQAAKSQIVVNAHRVNEGQYFLSKNELQEDSKQDCFIINETNQEKMLYQVLSLCTGRLQKFGNYDFFKNIQIITPTKKGMLGTRELNAYLQNSLNPEDKFKEEKKANGVIFRVGDRIMQIKNIFLLKIKYFIFQIIYYIFYYNGR